MATQLPVPATSDVTPAGIEAHSIHVIPDYSRYLPRNVSGPRTFWAVFSGNVLGTCLYAGLGIYITAMAPSASSVASIGSIAGKWILPILALSLLGSDALNAYTGMLAVESVRSTWQKAAASRTARVIGLLLIFLIGPHAHRRGVRPGRSLSEPHWRAPAPG